MQIDLPPCQFELFAVGRLGQSTDCRAHQCKSTIEVLDVMCMRHWSLLTPQMRLRVMDTYRSNRLPTKAHMLSVTAAVAEVADAEKILSRNQAPLFLV